MGKFTNTTYTNTVNSLIQAQKNILATNPFLKFSDKKPTVVTYYKQNLEKTTTDEGSNDIYQTIGSQSSIWYNKINNFCIYGFDKVSIDLQISEYGMESSEIAGEAVVLPKTIIPTSGDYFKVNYIDEELLFIVNDTQSDGLDYGNGIWKIAYHLEKRDSLSDLEKQVVRTYTYNAAFEGTDYKVVIEEDTAQLVNKLDGALDMMTSLYQSYYDNNVQSFTYRYNGALFYDPYMIEFMMRTGIMKNSEKYIFIDHATPVPNTFAFDYSKSFFYLIENPSELESREWKDTVCATAITDVNTLFVTRLETYYKVDYLKKYEYISSFSIFPAEVSTKIITGGEYFDESSPYYIYNLLLAHMKGDNDYLGTSDLISVLTHLDSVDNKEYFYLIPICMYILNNYIGSLLH